MWPGISQNSDQIWNFMFGRPARMRSLKGSGFDGHRIVGLDSFRVPQRNGRCPSAIPVSGSLVGNIMTEINAGSATNTLGIFRFEGAARAIDLPTWTVAVFAGEVRIRSSALSQFIPAKKQETASVIQRKLEIRYLIFIH